MTNLNYPGKVQGMCPSNQNVNQAQNDIYKIIDKVAETGIPATLECKGKQIVISASMVESKLKRLEEHPDFLLGDPEDVVHIEWSHEWMPNL